MGRPVAGENSPAESPTILKDAEININWMVLSFEIPKDNSVDGVLFDPLTRLTMFEEIYSQTWRNRLAEQSIGQYVKMRFESHRAKWSSGFHFVGIAPELEKAEDLKLLKSCYCVMVLATMIRL